MLQPGGTLPVDQTATSRFLSQGPVINYREGGYKTGGGGSFTHTKRGVLAMLKGGGTKGFGVVHESDIEEVVQKVSSS